MTVVQRRDRTDGTTALDAASLRHASQSSIPGKLARVLKAYSPAEITQLWDADLITVEECELYMAILRAQNA